MHELTITFVRVGMKVGIEEWSPFSLQVQVMHKFDQFRKRGYFLSYPLLPVIAFAKHLCWFWAERFGENITIDQRRDVVVGD